MIELRFFRERYNMDRDYYLGDNDVYCRLYFNTIGELTQQWDHIMEVDDHALEGETYSAWYVVDGEGFKHFCECLCGGAFDPGDIEYITREYKKAVNKI